MKKYLLYSIGEILLVMIGILLALQVNNWNEQRKDRAFEKEILTQIRANLLKDRVTLVTFMNNSRKAMSCIDKTLDPKLISERKDSMRYWLGSIMQFDRFQPLTSAYEALKVKGIDLIANKQLRFLLATYYDDKAVHIIKAFGDIEDVFSKNWITILEHEVVDFKFKKYASVRNENLFDENFKWRNKLILNRDNFGGSVIYVEQAIVLIDGIIEAIKLEVL